MPFRATSKMTTIDLPPEEERPSDHHEITIRPLPKFVFLYPTFIMSLVMIVISAWFPGAEPIATWIFLAVVFLNFQVIGTDFSALSALAAVLGITAVVLALVLAGVSLGQVLAVGNRLKPDANTDHYIVLAIGMAVVFVQILFVVIRLDYWRVMPNRIIHQHGLRDQVDMLPAPGGVVQKDITDVMEYALLRSGRLVIRPTKGEDIVLENVPNINKVERQLLTMLEAMDTRLHDPTRHHDT